jgi:hypothetical protein
MSFCEESKGDELSTDQGVKNRTAANLSQPSESLTVSEEITGLHLSQELKSPKYLAEKARVQPIRCLGSLQISSINSEGKVLSVKSFPATFKVFDNEVLIKEIS